MGWLGAKPGNAALEWMAPGLGGGIEGEGSLAIILAIISALIALLIGASGQPALSLKAAGAGLASGLRTGGLCGVIIGLLSGPIFVVLDGGVKYGLMYGTGVGVISGLVAGLMSGLLAGLSYDPARSRLLEPNEKRSWLARLGDGLIIGFCSLLGFEMVGMLLHLDLTPTIADGLLLSLVSFFTFGFGGGTNMIHRLGREITPVEMVTWSWLQVRQDLKDNLSKGAAIAGTVMVPTRAVVVAIGAISYNIPYGIRYGFIYGIIVGVVAGVAGTLAGILKSGWNGQTLSEHQQFKPNAGIVRTAWHGVIAACIFGPVGGIACNDAIGKGWGNNGDVIGMHRGHRQSAATTQVAAGAEFIHQQEHGRVRVMGDAINAAAPESLLSLAMVTPTHGYPNGGFFTYDASSDQVQLQWHEATSQRLLDIACRTYTFLDASSHTKQRTLSTPLAQANMTAHPLGGMVLGAACDQHSGKVLGYDNLFVVDGSLLPGWAGGAPPALTIAALAEYLLDQFIHKRSQ